MWKNVRKPQAGDFFWFTLYCCSVLFAAKMTDWAEDGSTGNQRSRAASNARLERCVGRVESCHPVRTRTLSPKTVQDRHPSTCQELHSHAGVETFLFSDVIRIIERISASTFEYSTCTSDSDSDQYTWMTSVYVLANGHTSSICPMMGCFSWYTDWASGFPPFFILFLSKPRPLPPASEWARRRKRSCNTSICSSLERKLVPWVIEYIRSFCRDELRKGLSRKR